eukprot:3418484-Rhodomonas_salina.1
MQGRAAVSSTHQDCFPATMPSINIMINLNAPDDSDHASASASDDNAGVILEEEIVNKAFRALKKKRNIKVLKKDIKAVLDR